MPPMQILTRIEKVPPKNKLQQLFGPYQQAPGKLSSLDSPSNHSSRV